MIAGLAPGDGARRGAARLRRYGGRAGVVRSRHHGRHRGGAPRRRSGPADLDPAAVRPGLALAAGARPTALGIRARGSIGSPGPGDWEGAWWRGCGRIWRGWWRVTCPGLSASKTRAIALMEPGLSALRVWNDPGSAAQHSAKATCCTAPGNRHGRRITLPMALRSAIPPGPAGFGERIHGADAAGDLALRAPAGELVEAGP